MKRFQCLLLIFFALMMISCHRTPPPPLTPEQQLALKRMELREDLAKAGVQIVQKGETFRVIIPADAIYYPNSANFHQTSAKTLRKLVAWLRTYTTTSLEVAGFTDYSGYHSIRTAISRHQAQVLADFLVTCGIDARLVYAIGYDGDYPIANNDYLYGRILNRRVELCFQAVTPPKEIYY